MRLFLQKNQNATDDNKQPILRLSAIIEKEGEESEFVPIAAFWRAKSGNGFSGKLEDTAVLSFRSTGNTGTVTTANSHIGQSAAQAQDDFDSF